MPDVSLEEEFEGCPLVSYQDQGGKWTIAYGHTLGVYPGMTCTHEQAIFWLQQDVQAAFSTVSQLVTVPLTEYEVNAISDFVFNVGAGNFRSSTFLRQINQSDYAGAAEELVKWDLVQGKVVAGLLRRRQAERDLFLGKGDVSC